MAEKKQVDCRGLSCPQPVLETKRALQSATSPFVVLVDNEGSLTNVTRYAESQGASVSVETQGAVHRLVIVPGHNDPAAEAPPIVCDSAAARNLVVYVSSEGMGRGSDELGATLMAAFLDTLSQFKDELTHLIFVNAGAKLTVEGSPVLGQIRQLEEMGIEVLVCGTCLNFYGIADKLVVGSVSNMFAIIETLSMAGRIIRP
jgi:selenium metabolism protein YedF